ncbi:MAG: hypothetical protein GY700_06455 [Propionibacteriaceae bacterium]|nr:hypothetical protein [Propionibacteriaceae bacterium]
MCEHCHAKDERIAELELQVNVLKSKKVRAETAADKLRASQRKAFSGLAIVLSILKEDSDV